MVTLPPQALLVDMDGTLIDTETVVVPVLRQATREIVGVDLSPEQARTYIGPPLMDTMVELAGSEGDAAIRLMTRYRALYSERHLEIELFDGIRPMLDHLRDAGVRLALATSKPEDRAQALLDHYGIAGMFEAVCGAPPDDGPGSEKAAVVGRALRALGLVERPDDVLMLGDRCYDVEGAAQWGVRTVLALWSGLAGPDEQAAAWATAHTPAQAARIVRGEES